MRVHYALMDDLCSWEEFERLVRERTGDSGDEDDERSAAREVISGAGRLHTRLAGIRAGPSLVSFFCRVIEVRKAERFERPGGGYGFVSRILCGDDTGEVILTLWDDKAFAVSEISEGEIIEVIGRFRRRGSVDIADLRKPENPPDIILRRNGMRSLDPVVLDAVILAFAGKGVYQAGDGTSSPYIRVIAGNSSGEAEILFWNNDSPDSFSPGDHVRISGIFERPSSGPKRSYSAGGNAVVGRLPPDADVECRSFTDKIPDIHDGWSGSLSASVEDPGSAREFLTRKDGASYVRNLVISDETGGVTLVVWGEQARLPYLKGDNIDIFFAEARVNAGTTEIHAGYNSFISFRESGGREVSIRGFIVPRGGYFSIDNEDGSWPLMALKAEMRGCTEACVSGILYDSGRLEVAGFSGYGTEPSVLKERIFEIRKNAGC